MPGSLVIEQSRIAAVEPAQGTTSNAWILPGLIDAHLHPLEVGLELLFANLAGARTIVEVLDRLAEHRAAAAESGMMLGFNLEPDDLVERRYPCRIELDQVMSDVPMLVYRVDGHSAVTNTAGLALLSPLNALGTEVDSHGEPTGVLRGPAYEQASRRFKRRLPPELVRESLLRCGQEAVRQGVTTIAALIGTEETTGDELQVMLDALASGLPRAVPFVQTWNHEVVLEFGLDRIGGCLLIDGSFGSHTAALKREYADAAGNLGMAFVTDEKLVSFLRRSEELRLSTAFHAIGDRAVEQVVRCHERIGRSSLRHRIEHAELLNPGLIERIARLKLVLGVQPAFEATWGGPDRMYSCRLGERWRLTNPFRSLIQAGVVLAGSSDAPITPICPLAGIRAALEHPNAEQRVTPEQALAMFTRNAAFSLGLEREVGRLAPGFSADLTILTGDPRNMPDCRVAATCQGGNWVFKDNNLLKSLGFELQ
ncbi:MAG: amidohydrolase [candidate division WOR-3 bacterium]